MTTSLVVAIAVVCAATTPPSAADLAAKGQKSLGRLSTSGALWTASLPVNETTGPRPIVIALSDFSEAPLTARPGLWAYPSWR